ncbi:MAG TPA: NUDIX hydrolase [Xanthobacteraceae bacterium]|jgi:8-oxo-dGTP pyrophosphatase MutT (NUDIX family)|nr:NUDIX hydrolase [Xanthobacteraceae bacterium]
MDDDLSVITGGSAADRAERLTRSMRDQSFPNVKPRDSATLILVDHAAKVPKVLLGRRHERHRFLPGKFVFPGGRIERADRLMAVAAALHEHHATKLMQRVRRPSIAKAAAFALAAVRETYEETGIMLGTRASGPMREPMRVPPGPWEAFARAGIAPDLSAVHFIARAITPPRRPLRFDSRFFTADVAAIARREEGFVGADKELVELVWLPITEARRLDMPGITAVVLEELQDRIAAGMSHEHPVPLYRMLHKRFVREIL